MSLFSGRRAWHAPCTTAAREVTTMDLSTIMNPAVVPPGTLGLIFGPTALFTVWIGLVVAILAGLTSVLGMERWDEPADRNVARTPDIVSQAPRDERAAA
jgi:hypothetical protein